jgi:hypothetical protein
MARLLITVAFLAGSLAMPAARAQAPAELPTAAEPAPVPPNAPTPPAPPTAPGIAQRYDDLPPALPNSASARSSASDAAALEPWEPQFLKSMPHPLDMPRSLYQPPLLAAPPPDLERPYFELDPILDPPQWPVPGWFADVELGAIHPHVESRQSDTTTNVVTTKLGRMVNVALGNARLDWAVSPRFEVGYRLPSGFGQFSMSTRFFSANGTQTIMRPDGPALLTTRLGVSYTDWDYSSREYTPWTNWGMQWFVGLRLAYTDTDNHLNEPIAQAAAGRGIFAAIQDSSTQGMGPHWGFGLDRKIGQSGLSFVTNLDDAYVFSRLNQTFGAATTALLPNGKHDSGILVQKGIHTQNPVLTWRVGLSYQPPRYPRSRLFLGYLYQAWWASTENVNGASRGMFEDQGVVLQGGINF